MLCGKTLRTRRKVGQRRLRDGNGGQSELSTRQSEYAVGPRSRLTDVQLVSKAVKMCMGMGFPMGPGISWESHGNGNKTSELGMGMGMGGNGKLPQWEWELPALPWEFIPKGFIL